MSSGIGQGQMNFGEVSSLMMSRLWVSALASFGIVQGNVRCRLQKTHQEDQFRPTECSLSMNSVAPLDVGPLEFGIREGPQFAPLWKHSHAPSDYAHHFATSPQHPPTQNRQRREMIDLPVGSKPGWEHDQEDTLPLKTAAERLVSFVLASSLALGSPTRPLASLLVFHSLKQCQLFGI